MHTAIQIAIIIALTYLIINVMMLADTHLMAKFFTGEANSTLNSIIAVAVSCFIYWLLKKVYYLAKAMLNNKTFQDMNPNITFLVTIAIAIPYAIYLLLKKVYYLIKVRLNKTFDKR